MSYLSNWDNISEREPQKNRNYRESKAESGLKGKDKKYLNKGRKLQRYSHKKKPHTRRSHTQELTVFVTSLRKLFQDQ